MRRALPLLALWVALCSYYVWLTMPHHRNENQTFEFKQCHESGSRDMGVVVEVAGRPNSLLFIAFGGKSLVMRLGGQGYVVDASELTRIDVLGHDLRVMFGTKDVGTFTKTVRNIDLDCAAKVKNVMSQIRPVDY